MPEPIVCPGCRSVVAVPIGYSAPTIHCGICWGEVAVLTAPPVPPPPPPPAKYIGSLPDFQLAAPLPGDGTAAAGMAPLEALIARADARSAAPKPASAPVVVLPAIVKAKALGGPRPPSVPDAELVVPPSPKPLPLPPKAGPPVLRKAGSSADAPPPLPPMPRPKSRASDDDEFDRPRRSSRSNAPVALAIGGGFLALLTIVGGGILGYVLFAGPNESPTPTAAEVARKEPPPAEQNPLPRFDPPQPPPVPDPPAADAPAPDWPEVPGADGFTARMPPPVRELPTLEPMHDPNRPVPASGRKFRSDDRGFSFDIDVLSLPAGATPDVARMARLFGAGEVQPARVGGFDGFESARTIGTRLEARQAVRVGAKVFVLHVRLLPVGGRTRADAEAARTAFFNGFKVTADPNAGPMGNAGGGSNDPGPFDGPAPKLAARIDPFLAAVVFPGRGELYTIAQRPGSRTQGILRRYTYPGFVPTNSYHLPAAGTHAVGTEGDGRLAIATVGKPNEAPTSETERWAVTGDVQVFDLGAVFAGTVGERDELKPVASLLVGAKIAGLEPLADGRSAALLSLHPTANKARPWRTRLTRIDLSTGKGVTELELPDPAWRLRRSADGRKLYAAEVPLGPTGAPLLTVSRVANVLVIDAAGWTKERTRTTPGAAFDLAAGPADTFVAAVAADGGYKTYAVPPDGQTTDLAADGRAVALGHLGLSPDGRRLVTSAASGQGFAVYEVTAFGQPGGLTRKLFGRTAAGQPGEAGVPLGGAFDLTPDGRYALLHTGLVIEVGGQAR